MISLKEVIEVARPVEACFRYVADFRNTVEWDATAITATKKTKGPVGVGTRFALQCKAGPTKLDLDYEIVAFTPWHSLTLLGRGTWFSVEDVITFEDIGAGITRITYCADFTYHFGLDKVAKLGEQGLTRMGEASLQGLKAALTDNNPIPSTSAATQRKDQNLITALHCFTRAGYNRGRQRWLPMSTDLSNTHIVLTGATTGLGYATAIALLEAGARLTVVIRDPTKTDELQAGWLAETRRMADRVEIADLSLIAEVDALSDRLLERNERIDVLINNAGALFNEYQQTAEGIERSTALLLLSPWRLTERLYPLLRGHSEPARIINVISGGMYTQKLDCSRLIMPPEKYNGTVAYARAKRALTVMTELWADRWAKDNIVVNSMHPGWADTPGVQSALPGFRRITRRVLRTPAEGADTIIWLARAREAGLISGCLFLDREARPTHLKPGTVETPDERAALPDWLADTCANLHRPKAY